MHPLTISLQRVCKVQNYSIWGRLKTKACARLALTLSISQSCVILLNTDPQVKINKTVNVCVPIIFYEGKKQTIQFNLNLKTGYNHYKHYYQYNVNSNILNLMAKLVSS